MYLLEEDEGNDEEIMRLLETTTDSLSTSSSTRSGGDGRTTSSPVFQDERVSLPVAMEAAGDNAAPAVGETHENEPEHEGKGHSQQGRRMSSEIAAGEDAKVALTNPPSLGVTEREESSTSLTLPETSQLSFSLHTPTSSLMGLASPPTECLLATCNVTSCSLLLGKHN